MLNVTKDFKIICTDTPLRTSYLTLSSQEILWRLPQLTKKKCHYQTNCCVPTWCQRFWWGGEKCHWFFKKSGLCRLRVLLLTDVFTGIPKKRWTDSWEKGIILPPTTISPQFTSTWSASHCTKTLGTKHPSYSSKIPNPWSLIMFFLRSSNFLIMPPKYLLFHLLPAVPDVLLPIVDFSLPAALTFLIFWKRWKRFLVMKLIMNSLNMVSKSTCY